MPDQSKDKLVETQKEIIAKAQALLLAELNKTTPDLKRSIEFSQTLNNVCQSLYAINKRQESP